MSDCLLWACFFFFFFSSRRRHTRFDCDWSSDVCSSDLVQRDHLPVPGAAAHQPDLAVLLGQVAAEPRHEAEWPIGMLAVTRGAERYDVAQDAVGAERHAPAPPPAPFPVHTRCAPRGLGSGPRT